MSQLALNFGFSKQLLRFVMTGGLNTALGFAVIWALLAVGISDIPANIAGYAIGLVVSFFVNRHWTFEQSSQADWREVALFGGAFVGAYSANLTVILVGQRMEISGNPLLHLAGIIVYTIMFFFLSKAVVYAPVGKSASGVLTKLMARWPEIITLSVLTVVFNYVLTLRLTHDVSWQFWIARQMLGGVPLYTHIMEINPPLWFWMALPMQQLGTALEISPDRLYISAIFLTAVWSTLLTGHLLFESDTRRRFAFMLSIVLLCLLAPQYDFGQREQLVAILALPYGALLFKRMRGEHVSPGLAFAIGIMAAFGFALKHYFALVPLALEFWFLWQSRSIWHAVRMETLSLGLLAVLYAIAIVIFTPDFFRVIMPMIDAAYQGYEKPLIEQLVRIEVLIWLFATLSYPSIRRNLHERDRAIGDMLGISAVAFAASYFLQQKGWQYHAIPATVLASLLMVHCFAAQEDLVKALVRHPAAFLAAILFLSIGLGRGPYDSEWAKPMARILAKEQAGTGVMILTVDPRRVFPFMDDYRLVWPSRHFAHWMVSGIAQAEVKYHGARLTPELISLSRQVRRQALVDMKCNPPSLILSQIRNSGVVLNPNRFRMTDFFRRDPQFRVYLATNYRLEWTSKIFEAYRRVTPLVAEGSNCYQISTPHIKTVRV